ncbi:MAG: hypothetical protein ACIARR_04495, partial [Phycisphaerales bacterium JB059]
MLLLILTPALPVRAQEAVDEGERLESLDELLGLEEAGSDAINSNKPFISAGFIGRGFGEDLLTAISVGVPNTEMTGRNIGIVEGS